MKARVIKRSSRRSLLLVQESGPAPVWETGNGFLCSPGPSYFEIRRVLLWTNCRLKILSARWLTTLTKGAQIGLWWERPELLETSYEGCSGEVGIQLGKIGQKSRRATLRRNEQTESPARTEAIEKFPRRMWRETPWAFHTACGNWYLRHEKPAEKEHLNGWPILSD